MSDGVLVTVVFQNPQGPVNGAYSPLQAGQHQARKAPRSSMPNLLIVGHQQPHNLLPRHGTLILDLLCLVQHHAVRIVPVIVQVLR